MCFRIYSHSFLCTYKLPAVQLQLCSCRNTRLLQLLRSIEGACRAGDRAVSCGAGGARPLGRSIRRGHRAGKARTFLAVRGAGDPGQGTGGAS
jgi:hypothetical protein